MSTVANNKRSQCYVEKPAPRTCCNCEHFSSDISNRPGDYGGTFPIEKNKRCRLGGFAVKKTATCSLFLLRQRVAP